MTDSGKVSRGYSQQQLAQFAKDFQRLRNQTEGTRLVLAELAERLTDPRARTFANEGIGRRLPLIGRSAQHIFALFPPGSQALLSRDTCEDIGIQLQAFAINMYGLLDNIAWVCMLEAGGSLSKEKIGLLRKDIAPFLPDDLKTYVAGPTMKKWFDDYGKVYRDSTAHRIPPYLPSRAYTQEEGAKFQELHAQSMSALSESARVMRTNSQRALELIDLHHSCDAQKEQLGSNSLLIALSLTGADFTLPVFMHPQLLCDWDLANEVVRTFDRAMRKHYGWKMVDIPDVRVG